MGRFEYHERFVVLDRDYRNTRRAEFIGPDDRAELAKAMREKAAEIEEEVAEADYILTGDKNGFHIPPDDVVSIVIHGERQVPIGCDVIFMAARRLKELGYEE